MERLERGSSERFIIQMSEYIQFWSADKTSTLKKQSSNIVNIKDSYELNDKSYTEEELTTKFSKDERELTPRQVMIILNGYKRQEDEGTADLSKVYVNVRRCMRNLPYINIDGPTISLNNKSFTIDKNSPASSAIDGLSKLEFEFI